MSILELGSRGLTSPYNVRLALRETRHQRGSYLGLSLKLRLLLPEHDLPLSLQDLLKGFSLYTFDGPDFVLESDAFSLSQVHWNVVHEESYMWYWSIQRLYGLHFFQREII